MDIKKQIENVISNYGLTGKNICIHSSFKSFGSKELKPEEIIKTFLANGCTILSPTFSYSYMRGPDKLNRPERNAWDYDKEDEEYGKNSNTPFHTTSNEIDSNMGVIPKTILSFEQRKRGDNPLDSFTAVGKNAAHLIQNQTPADVYNPFKKLIDSEGYVILMGVEFNKMTLIHHSEKEAGRNMFIRWATGAEVTTIPVETGGCSEGFSNLSEVMMPLSRRTKVGNSNWIILPAGKSFTAARDAIKNNPQITHCKDSSCVFCHDAVAGGPVLEEL